VQGMKPIIFYRAWRLAVLLVLANLSALPAAPPGWWLEEDTRVVSEENAPNDFGPVNIGQLKHMATQAKKHLDAFLPDGAGPAIDTLVSGFEPRSGVSYSPEELQAIRVANHSPANLGQMKAVAKPFYDRLAAEGYDTKANLIFRGYPANWLQDYPWDPQSPKIINYSPANLGQLKLIFSFDLSNWSPIRDGDSNALPDAWETENYGQTGVNPNAAAPSGDGQLNIDKYLNGGNPGKKDHPLVELNVEVRVR